MNPPLNRTQESAVRRIRRAQRLANSLAVIASRRAFPVLLLTVIAIACAGTRLTPLAPEQYYAPVPAESVLVFVTPDVIPEPYEPIVLVDMPEGPGGIFAKSAQREVGATGSNGCIFGAVGGVDAGSAAAGGALDIASALAGGGSHGFSRMLARARLQLIGIRSRLERRHETRPVAVLGGHKFRSIAGGLMHTCGVTRDEEAFCWGWNSVGQLGDGSTTARFEPTRISGYLDFASISAGLEYTCGTRKDGTAYCWGANEYGQLGRGYETEYSETATPVSDRLVLTALTTGLAHTCGLSADSAAYCWGGNSIGQLGTGDSTSTSRPTVVSGDLQFTQLAAGFFHTCGVTAAGAAHCWGWNSEGQLGDGTTSDRPTPMAVSREIAFASLTAGRLHTCGLTPAGAAYCWGFGATGALGNGSTKSKHKKPESVAGELTFRSLSAGGYFTCGLTNDGQAYCWGLNQHGQIGNDSTAGVCKVWRDVESPCSTAPMPVMTDLSFERLSVGVAHACAIATDGQAYCWGAGTAGQLGDRATAKVEVSALEGFTEEKLRELEGLPTGLTVTHTPNPVKARVGGPSGRRYAWVFGTTVTPTGSDTVTITEFGFFVWIEDGWVFSNFTGRPFTGEHFAEWYGCPDARILPDHECTDGSGWGSRDALQASRTRWYYIGVTSSGQRVKGEAILEVLAEVDTTKVP
jgi:alpha-tubulin suppressor-like RCC1 family protein